MTVNICIWRLYQ